MTRTFGLRASPERTFESLYRHHAADVYRYALLMLDSPADAEDVTQTTFLNAYRALSRGERPRAASSWLRTIAHNLCLQHFRTSARRPQQVELEDEAAALVSDEQGVEVEDLMRALAQIPVNQRAALVMRELEGRPIGAIADILGLSGSAVETLLFRARRSVREQLEGSLTCADAEQAISGRLDGTLPRAERGALRAHLRQCEECAHLARSVRAQRGAMRSLAAIPLPVALAWSKFGTGAAASGVAGASAGTVATGGAWVAGSVVSKVAVAAVLATITAGVGYEAAVIHPWTADRSAAARTRVGEGASGQPVSPGQRSGQTATSATPSGNASARRQAIQVGKTATKAAAVAASASGRTRASNVAALGGLTVPSANSHATGSSHSSTAAGTSQGRGSTNSTHPKLETHPAKPTHPTHPTKPTHPTSSAAPTTTNHGKGNASTTTTTTTAPTPGHHRPSHPA